MENIENVLSNNVQQPVRLIKLISPKIYSFGDYNKLCGCRNLGMLLKNDKNIVTISLRDLQMEYPISFEKIKYRSVKDYNAESSKIEFVEHDYDLDYKIKSNFDLKDKHSIIHALTLCINYAYLSLWKEYKSTKIGPIRELPPNMINEIFLESNEKILLEKIDLFFLSYISENGICVNSYEKQIDSSLIKIKNLSEQIDTGKQPQYGKLLPDYRDMTHKFKFNNIEYINLPEQQKDVMKKRIKVTEEVVSMIIPPKYRTNANIIIENGIWAHANLENIYISLEDTVPVIIHEYIHSLKYLTNKFEIIYAESNFLYEITKGREIRTYNNGNGNLYFYKETGINGLKKYATYMPHGFERNSPHHELLSVLIGDMLAKDIGVNESGVFNVNTKEKLTVEQVLKDRFSLICRWNKIQGAFILSFLNGEFGF